MAKRGSKRTYLVELPTGHVGRTNNLTDAKRSVRLARGGAIWALPYVPYANMTMDYPTFIASGAVRIPYAKSRPLPSRHQVYKGLAVSWCKKRY